MKKLLIILLLISSVPLLAQEETLLGSGHFDNGGFGGPVLKITSINKQLGVLVGGRGGWIINHSLVIGGGGYGLVNEVEANEIFFDGKRNLNFGYGGFEMEYLFEPSKIIHGSIYVLIGGGGVSYRNKFSGDVSYDWDKNTDNFFVVEPAVNLELNIISYMRMHLGASYRFISGVNTGGLKDSDLFGPTISFTMKFGKF